MKFTDLLQIPGSALLSTGGHSEINHLVTDSRQSLTSPGTVFFAIRGERHDGHAFVNELFESGIRLFVVEHDVRTDSLQGAGIIKVPSSLAALQWVAAHHRQNFSIPIIGITGSNGKTIVKEWLYQTLRQDLHIARSPGSYNSQIGVPLSLWQLQPSHQLGIFEAGISRLGEMAKLQKMIVPTIGIFTNVGSAHDDGFASRTEKASEKALLFSSCAQVIYCRDHALVHETLQSKGYPVRSWGRHPQSDIVVTGMAPQLTIQHAGGSFLLDLPFTDEALVENALHVMAYLLSAGYPTAVVRERLAALSPIPMRLEIKQAVNRCLIIDDSYNNDLAGLQISLHFLRNQRKHRKTLILSDLLQTGLDEGKLIDTLVALVSETKLHRFIGIGPVLKKHQSRFSHGECFESTEAFLSSYASSTFADEVILLKGARPFRLERIAERLARKVHRTLMEIDLTAMVQNLNTVRATLRPGVKIMAMVKAFAYGSGSEEVANLLQYHRVDYLGVAYADEGVELRKNNITLPIMVMNPSEEGFDALVKYQLEPEVYSLRMLQSLVEYLDGRPCTIHLKLDTGMHRLGFMPHERADALSLLRQHPEIRVATIFTHLAGADEVTHDSFSHAQVADFTAAVSATTEALGYQPMRHVLNSPGILRFPDYQFEMVRLGIGLYGIDPTHEGKVQLVPVTTLKTTISQIKNIKAGESIGYGRKAIAEKDLTIATIAIGYADGYSRSFSRGKGKLLIGNKRAPVIGNVCMDMTMIDITGIQAQEGDEVIVFGPQLPIEEVASWIDTIPYELLTQTSERVKRVFHTAAL